MEKPQNQCHSDQPFSWSVLPPVEEGGGGFGMCSVFIVDSFFLELCLNLFLIFKRFFMYLEQDSDSAVIIMLLL